MPQTLGWVRGASRQYGRRGLHAVSIPDPTPHVAMRHNRCKFAMPPIPYTNGIVCAIMDAAGLMKNPAQRLTRQGEIAMNILTTLVRNNHHWKRHASRAVMAYNTVMCLVLAVGIVEPLCNNWR